MTDISIFKKMLSQPPYSTREDYVWLAAHEVRPGQFAYHVGFKGWPISKLFTYSLTNARAAAKSFGVSVKEHGPPEAFGRTEYTPPQSIVDAFWHFVRLGDAGCLGAWLDRHRRDAPYLLELLSGEGE